MFLPRSPDRTKELRVRSPVVAGVSALALLLAATPSSAGREEGEALAASTEVRYGRDVRRILSDRCFQCHGSDPATREAELRLDLRAEAVADRGGHAAIAPGDPEASELWRRVTSEHADERMPPAAAKKRPLSDDDLDVLRRWIAAGAEYEPHWSFVAPKRPAPPRVENATWPRGAIDRFVLANLETRGVAPSPEADRGTLLRRVFLDLTGLPPTPAELDAFVSDGADDAYERAVDRLLTQEPYRTRLAEHLATPWLDAARYADTIGIHTDNGRQTWLWRDWVLKAFRDNLPYDRFAIEQLAGDLLPDATTDQRVASGFNRNHVITDEGGAIPDEYLVEYAVDRVSTTSSAFLGLTMGCARCHDHKFDPVTQRDFYGMVAFFNSIEEPGLYSQTPDANRAYEPFLEVPSAAQEQRIAELETRLEALAQRIEEPLPGEDEDRARFFEEVTSAAGVDWTVPAVLSAASSEEGVRLEVAADGTVTASGRHPPFEDHELLLRSDASELRALLLEVLTVSEDSPFAGRAGHGNAVVSAIAVDARPAGSPGAPETNGADSWTPVPLAWAWADHEQQNGDFEAHNVLRDDDEDLGWALDGHRRNGARALLLLAAEPFGFDGGTDLRVRLSYRSKYAAHSLGRVRVHVSPLADTELLPVAAGRWYRAGPFRPQPASSREAAYTTRFGPEDSARIDPTETFGEGKLAWTFDEELGDGAVHTLSSGLGAHYVGRALWSPDARDVDVSLGTDDGYLLYLNGEKIAEQRVDRGAAPDQEQVRLPLRAGENTLVLEIVNTGGPGAYYYRELAAERTLVDDLPSAITPAETVTVEQADDVKRAWRRRFFEGYRLLEEESRGLGEELAALRAEVPRAMVMRELDEPRATFLLKRGQYDHPDEEQPVERAVPAFLPAMPADAPRDRLGLARWMVADENPLFARVAVNRFWQLLFGAGLVRTPEDFGLQGDWPTHPELLDWLAVEFRESGWNVHGLLRAIVTSSTYRQSSRTRPELAERDPDNRWLAFYPRRRLSAEQIRDLALYASGLLVERLGGPSVKPYQPEGLWKEVAMLASNTRDFERGEGEELWRRSLYTYWKRAVPPPALQTFDAPTRESCVIRRQRTNTPLQALVLWNDVQFVEAARALALRVLDGDGGDEERLAQLLLACAGRAPEAEESALLAQALRHYRARFAELPADAAELTRLGTRMADEGVDRVELAAWTMIASAALNLHETLTND